MKNILILGAGQSTAFLIHRLLELAPDRDWMVTVADADEDLAQRRVLGHARGQAIPFDVNDTDQRAAWIQRSDLVINMLPVRFQPLVGWDCVTHGRHMMSASYRDQAMRDLHRDAKRKGVLILCELGLDPGIDHMSAMAVIEKIRGEGGRIVSFCSYGSGIPAPDQRQNPLRYVITWNPRNVVMASEYGAQYMEDGKIKIVPFQHAFHHTWEVEVDGVGSLEAYPNRDSLSYMDAFGLDDVHTMIRGTLRWPGWCETWSRIVALGLPNEQIHIPKLAERTYAEVVEMFLPMNVTGGPPLETRLANFLQISPTGRIMQNLKWLGLLDDVKTGCQGDNAAAMLVDLLCRKLPLEPDMRDMIILVHRLEVEYPDRAAERVISTLVAKGEPGGFTAMSRSVGLPVAVGVDLLFSGKLPLTGCHIPTHPSVYEPELAALATDGLTFQERREPL